MKWFLVWQVPLLFYLTASGQTVWAVLVALWLGSELGVMLSAYYAKLVIAKENTWKRP